MIVLGLGSSRYDVAADALGWLRRAVAALKAEPALVIREISPIYRSDAMLPPGAPASWDVPYLNLALSCDWAGVTPEKALTRTQAIERRLGRRPRERWAPREIDIDLLAWGDATRGDATLGLPHAGLLERPFALLPLADVAPTWRHPLAGRSARELASTWRLASADDVPFRTQRTRLRLTEIMGILNVTPDSFSDGGRFDAPAAAASRARELVAAGATVIDVGAESTRPGAKPVAPADEWRRLEPVLRELARLRDEGSGVSPAITPFGISVDTRHAETARRALGLGVDWINDVEGLESESMIEAVRDSSCALVFMHSLGVPPTRARQMPRDQDVVGELLRWGEAQAVRLESRGIARSRLIFDPGIGFGKSAEQNWQCLREATRFHALGLRVLIGHSRKSFLADIAPGGDRDLESVLIGERLSAQGIEFVRIHDVAMQARALTVGSLAQPYEVRISAHERVDPVSGGH